VQVLTMSETPAWENSKKISKVRKKKTHIQICIGYLQSRRIAPAPHLSPLCCFFSIVTQTLSFTFFSSRPLLSTKTCTRAFPVLTPTTTTAITTTTDNNTKQSTKNVELIGRNLQRELDADEKKVPSTLMWCSLLYSCWLLLFFR
jgi:hypothetical protein